jgi:hypothetical protein
MLPESRNLTAKARGDFLAWCASAGVASLAQVQPLHVAAWIERETRTSSTPSVKQKLAATVQTLRNRKLIARSAHLGPQRERIWRTTQLFLDSFGLASLDKLYREGRMEEVFASVYSGETGSEHGTAPSDNALTEGSDAL